MSRSKCRLELDGAFFLCRGTSTICLWPQMDELSLSPTLGMTIQDKMIKIYHCRVLVWLIGQVVRRQNVISRYADLTQCSGAVAGQSDGGDQLEWAEVDGAGLRSHLQSEQCDLDLSTCQMPIRSPPLTPDLNRRTSSRWKDLNIPGSPLARSSREPALGVGGSITT